MDAKGSGNEDDRLASMGRVAPTDVKSSSRSASRKKTKHGRYISDITLEEILQYTHVPAHVAADMIGLGLTSFKRLCRQFGILAWPYKATGIKSSSGRRDQDTAGTQSQTPLPRGELPPPPQVSSLSRPISQSVHRPSFLGASYSSAPEPRDISLSGRHSSVALDHGMIPGPRHTRDQAMPSQLEHAAARPRGYEQLRQDLAMPVSEKGISGSHRDVYELSQSLPTAREAVLKPPAYGNVRQQEVFSSYGDLQGRRSAEVLESVADRGKRANEDNMVQTILRQLLTRSAASRQEDSPRHSSGGDKQRESISRVSDRWTRAIDAPNPRENLSKTSTEMVQGVIQPRDTSDMQWQESNHLQMQVPPSIAPAAAGSKPAFLGNREVLATRSHLNASEFAFPPSNSVEGIRRSSGDRVVGTAGERSLDPRGSGETESVSLNPNLDPDVVHLRSNTSYRENQTTENDSEKLEPSSSNYPHYYTNVKVKLLQLMQFSAEMKRSIGVSIIDDVSVRELYQKCKEETQELEHGRNKDGDDERLGHAETSTKDFAADAPSSNDPPVMQQRAHSHELTAKKNEISAALAQLLVPATTSGLQP